MRFVLAIVSFLVAALLIGFGVAQRTILLLPDEVSLGVEVDSDASLTVIDGAVLNAFPGSQTLQVRGEGTVFAGYGRTADVLAWVGENEYTRLVIDPETEQLVAEHVAGLPAVDPAAGVAEQEGAGTEAPQTPAEPPVEVPGDTAPVEPAPTFLAVPDPFGSDLWLEDYVQQGSLQLTVNVPAEITVLIASDGTAPAPGMIELTWPVDNSTPWAVPLILAGTALLLLGLAALVWAILHLRSLHGPRRKPGKMPKLPRRPRTPRPSRKDIEQKVRGRRAAGRAMIAVPVVLGALVLSSCSAVPRPQTTPEPTPTAAAPDAPQLPPPAASARQIERIVARAIDVAAEADEARDAELLATRFAGPALTLRQVTYAILAEDSSLENQATIIPQGAVKLMLPQQTAEWPRTILAIVQDETDATVPPATLVLVQNSPRENYKVRYAVNLEPGITFPEVAPASLGTARLGADSAVLRMAPTLLAMAYADIMANDIESQVYLDFEVEGDSLRPTVGKADRARRAAELPTTAAMTFSERPGNEPPIALSTIDSGAVVAVELLDSTLVAPVEEGAAVNTAGLVKALSGVAMTTSGISTTHQIQLLLYVPAADSEGKIILLGWTHGLIEAKEVS